LDFSVAKVAGPYVLAFCFVATEAGRITINLVFTPSRFFCLEFTCTAHRRVKTESYGTRRSTGGEVKGKEVNGVGSQHSCTVSEDGLSSITTADAYTSAASSRLN